MNLEKVELFFHTQPKKISLRDDTFSQHVFREAPAEQCDLVMPKPPPHSPPPELPPALPLSLSKADPPTPPPFVPALQPVEQPMLPCTTLHAPLPTSLPPLLPPLLPESYPTALPPPYPPSLPPPPPSTPPTGFSLMEPPILSPGLAVDMAPGAMYCEGDSLMTCMAANSESEVPALLQWFPPLHTAMGVPQQTLMRQQKLGLEMQPRANPGSALHAEGNCHPCAWFWKSPGCRNGENCDHCHLCPEGEVKARKKARQTIKRLGYAPSTPQISRSQQGATDTSGLSQEKTPPTLPNSPGSSELESTTGSASDREWTAGSGSEQATPTARSRRRRPRRPRRGPRRAWSRRRRFPAAALCSTAWGSAARAPGSGRLSAATTAGTAPSATPAHRELPRPGRSRGGPRFPTRVVAMEQCPVLNARHRRCSMTHTKDKQAAPKDT